MFEKVNEHQNNQVYSPSISDEDPLTMILNDTLRRDNKDAEKILATIAFAVILFTNKNPEKSIVVKGNSAVRTRYYNIKLSQALTQINKRFEMLRSNDEIDWGIFQKVANNSIIYTT